MKFATVALAVGFVRDEVVCSFGLDFLLYQELVCEGRVDCVGMPGMKLNFLLYQELVCDGRMDYRNSRDEVICFFGHNFLLRNWFATGAWTVRMPVMKLFVPVDIIFCCNRNWFATVAWTVRMPGMRWTASCWHRKPRDWSTTGQPFPAAQVSN